MLRIEVGYNENGKEIMFVTRDGESLGEIEISKELFKCAYEEFRFKKSDLEEGMVVVINHEPYIKCGKYFISEDGFMPVSDYDENLKLIRGSMYEGKWDIKEVYKNNMPGFSLRCITEFKTRKHELIKVFSKEDK